MHTKTLVLNSAYEPLGFINIKDAFVRVYLGKAYMVEKYPDTKLRTVDKEYDAPSVIRTKRFVRAQYKRVPLTKRNIYIRDNYTCGYTGKRLTDYSKLSIDHIIPRSKGGGHTWDNVVTCEQKLNEEKGDYLLGIDPEVDHLPIPKVGRPHYLLIMQNGIKNIPDAWKPYLYL